MIETATVSLIESFMLSKISPVFITQKAVKTIIKKKLGALLLSSWPSLFKNCFFSLSKVIPAFLFMKYGMPGIITQHVSIAIEPIVLPCPPIDATRKAIPSPRFQRRKNIKFQKLSLFCLDLIKRLRDFFMQLKLVVGSFIVSQILKNYKHLTPLDCYIDRLLEKVDTHKPRNSYVGIK